MFSINLCFIITLLYSEVLFVCIIQCNFGLYVCFCLPISRLHRTHEMQTILTDVRGGCLSVCLSVRRHSVRLSRGLNRRQHVQCARGHSVQPLSNYFDHLLILNN